ncbi:hypothetical protein [Kitasatospora sp. NPDC101183]|uniref:hypothetical protein n=1 Tax=Kitasatospora sp. NPDC101183 TaxID=3364100 RepID=UPI0037F4B0E8
MASTIAVHAEPPKFGRRGTFRVVVDDVLAGQVKQGETLRVPVPAGAHTVRVTAKDRVRSNTLTVQAVEGLEHVVAARGTGLHIALALLVGVSVAAVPWGGLVAALVVAAVLYAVPGLLFRVHPVAVPQPWSAPVPEQPQAGGLWWESDPALAKRYRKDGTA